MQTPNSIDPASATGTTRQFFDGLQKNLGTVPNLMRVLANSPAAPNGYMSFSGVLGEGKLSPRTREQRAIAMANANSCDYCLSALNDLGKLAGLATDDLALAADTKRAAALRFAVEAVRKRGLAPPSEVETLRTARFSDGEVVEIIAAVNIFTNYFNHIAGTEIDFPVVKATAAR